MKWPQVLITNSIPSYQKGLNPFFVFSACLTFSPQTDSIPVLFSVHFLDFHRNKLNLSQSKVCLRFSRRSSEKQQSDIFILYTGQRFSKAFIIIIIIFYNLLYEIRNIVICHVVVDIVCLIQSCIENMVHVCLFIQNIDECH